MKVEVSKVVDANDYNDNVTGSFLYIRVDPGDYKDALMLILKGILDKTWLSAFDNEITRASFEARANDTIEAFQKLFNLGGKSDPLLEDVGEYIVSYFALNSLPLCGDYNNVPLMELIGVKATGNAGFDFYSERIDENLLFCGEAKYLASGYGYNSSLKQINDFILAKKHVKDAALLEKFVSKESLTKMVNGEVGVCSAFSSKKDDEELISDITNNSHFIHTLNQYKRVIMIAVSI